MKASASMACVRVGFQELLLDADDALKLVKLLNGATACDKDYIPGGGGYVYRVTQQTLSVELTLLKSDQVRMPEGAPIEPVVPRRSPRQLKAPLPLLERTR